MDQYHDLYLPVLECPQQLFYDNHLWDNEYIYSRQPTYHDYATAWQHELDAFQPRGSFAFDTWPEFFYTPDHDVPMYEFNSVAQKPPTAIHSAGMDTTSSFYFAAQAGLSRAAEWFQPPSYTSSPSSENAHRHAIIRPRLPEKRKPGRPLKIPTDMPSDESKHCPICDMGAGRIEEVLRHATSKHCNSKALFKYGVAARCSKCVADGVGDREVFDFQRKDHLQKHAHRYHGGLEWSLECAFEQDKTRARETGSHKQNQIRLMRAAYDDPSLRSDCNLIVEEPGWPFMTTFWRELLKL